MLTHYVSVYLSLWTIQVSKSIHQFWNTFIIKKKKKKKLLLQNAFILWSMEAVDTRDKDICDFTLR